MRSTILVLLFFIQISCFSQDTTNLVPNWSFEEKIACPSTQFFEDFIVNWFNPTQATPNYFDTCATFSQVDIPHNLSIGFQYAWSGFSYSGIVLFGGSTQEREYISIKLNNKLKYNHSYCFELYYSFSNISCNSTPDLHAYFSSDSLFQNDSYFINRFPQVINTNPNISDSLNWQLMDGEFISDGTEQYLTIGNFYNDTQTEIILFDTNFNSCSYGGAYYYIDAVRLFDCTQPDTTVYEISVFPNPNNGSFTVNYNLGENINSGIFRVYDAIGKLVYDEKLTQNNGRLDLNLFLSSGIYFWEVTEDTGSILKSSKMVIVD